VLVYTAATDRERADALAARGAEVVVLPAPEPAAVLADLARRGVQSVLVEGGAAVAGAFRDAALWDRAVAYVAPRLVGGAAAPAAIEGVGVGALADAEPLERVRSRRCGTDFEITGIRAGCLRELSSSVGA
jgi:diaminohydroxyphosphoribosylaminopyrimidine deaminase/5-amino-6-(5-phosphoribosylamino)uracil reductase